MFADRARLADRRQPDRGYHRWYRGLEDRSYCGRCSLGSTMGSTLRECAQDHFFPELATRRLVQCREWLIPRSAECWAYLEGQRSALVLSIDRKGKPAAIPQEIRHPRPLTWIGWRTSTSARYAHRTSLWTPTDIAVLMIICTPSPKTRSSAYTRPCSTIPPGSSCCPALTRPPSPLDRLTRSTLRQKRRPRPLPPKACSSHLIAIQCA